MSFSHTVTCVTPDTSATWAAMASTGDDADRWSDCARRTRRGASVSASVPGVASRRFVTSVHPDTGVAMVVSVPAGARMRPAVSASAATVYCADPTPTPVTVAVVTQTLLGSPAAWTREPAGSVVVSVRATRRVTVPFVAAARAMPGAISQSASRAAPEAPDGVRAA